MFTYLISISRLLRFSLQSLFSGLPQSLIALSIAKRFGTAEDLEVIYKKLGKRLKTTLEKFGPSFIKLGQTLATRSDIVGESIAEELSKLQDRLEPFPYKEVEKTIFTELGKPINRLFLTFDKVPKAAASIAQVHRAQLMDGRYVAVKILRPRIEKLLKYDIQLFYIVANIINKLHPRAKSIRPLEVVKQLEESTKRELDLRLEAAAADFVKDNIKQDSGVKIPKIYWQLTSKRVLTTKWVSGIPLTNKAALIKKGHNLHDIAKKLAVTFFNQAYRDGFFHADLHPGNILVTKKGDIALVDFGIIGVLKKEERIFIAQMLYGFIQRDYKKVARLHFEIGYVPKHKDPTLFAMACRSIGEPIIGLPVNQISIGKLLKQLFDIAQTFDMVIQPQLILLQKTMITLEGVGYTIYPEVNMWQLAEPWIKEWANETFGVKATLLNIKDAGKTFVQELPNTLERIDRIIERLDSQDHFVEKKKVVVKKVNSMPIAIAILIGMIIGYII